MPPINGECTPANGARVCLAGVCDEADGTCGLRNGRQCGPPPEDAVCQSGLCFLADSRCGEPNSEPCTTAAICRSDLCFGDQRCGLPNGEPCAANAQCRSECVAIRRAVRPAQRLAVHGGR